MNMTKELQIQMHSRAMREEYGVWCLKMFTDELKDRGVPYWIDFGTLLGAYRENWIISDDKDIDIGIMDEYAEVVKDIVYKGMETGRWANINWHWRDGQIYQLTFPNIFGEFSGFETYNWIFHLDIYFYQRRSNRAVFLYNTTLNRESYRLPIGNVTKLEQYRLGKHIFDGPSDVESILRIRYGSDYMTPKKMCGDVRWCDVKSNVDEDFCSEYINKNTVAYTAVVCDMFHIGHLNLFRRMKQKYGKVIVGVHDDESISYKPKPIVSYEHRLDIVRSCKYVDEVLEHAPVITTDEVLNRVNAHIVVAGREDEEYIKRLYPVSKWRLELMERTANVSSSDLKRKIMNIVSN